MHVADSNSVYYSRRAAFAKLIGLFTFGLIFAGGVVTSKNVGLSVPDWPTSYGYHMWGMPFAMWKGGVFYEHLHRVLASIDGCLVLIMCIWLFCAEKRRWLRGLGLGCLLAVVLQGFLGGLTVLLALPTVVSVAHGILAQIFFCLTIVLAYGLSRERSERARALPERDQPRIRRGAWLLVALMFCQLIIAASMRHDMKHQGGVAVPDFPTIAGSWSPVITDATVEWVNAWRTDAAWSHEANFELGDPVSRGQIVLHVAHRLMAAVLVLVVIGLALHSRRHYANGHPVRRTLQALLLLLLLQAALGVLVIWSNKGELITSLHVVTGAATLGAAVLLVLRVIPAHGVAGREVPA
ncbi:MAG: COX15/CtaA family protein [Verrucomicrobia bacterium]|nr:COX15/CtaA family protein [Verrucomicrobiota bacterium]